MWISRSSVLITILQTLRLAETHPSQKNVASQTIDSSPSANLFYPQQSQPTTFGQNSAEFVNIIGVAGQAKSSNNNINIPPVSFASNSASIKSSSPNVNPNDEYGSHLAYPNSGYGNYNNGNDHNDGESSITPATPEEIESSYKSSLIHLKSQNGQNPQHPLSSTLSDFKNIPQSSFLNVLSTKEPQSESLQSFREPIVPPHLPPMQIGPGHSPFPDIYSTSSPHPHQFPSNVIPSPSQVTFGGPNQLSPIFKGVVENAPISLQQKALEDYQRQNSPHPHPQPLPKDFSVDVHYPPKIHEFLHHTNGQPHIFGGGSGSGSHLKVDFHPSEPDLSKFPQIQPHSPENAFHAPTMSSGFSPSFGPIPKLPLEHHHLNKFPLPENIQPHPEQIQPHPQIFFKDYNPHPQSYQHQHQEFPNYSGHLHGPEVIAPQQPPPQDFHQISKHPELDPFKFLFFKGPSPSPFGLDEPRLKYNEAEMSAYLQYLSSQSGHNNFPFVPNPLPTTIYERDTHTHFLQPEDSDESPSNQGQSGVDPSPSTSPSPNSFDKLFPKRSSLRRRIKNRNLRPKIKKSNKNLSPTRRRRKKNKNRLKLKKVTIALNPSFKGKILPHHWDQLAAQLISKQKHAGALGSKGIKDQVTFGGERSKSSSGGHLLSMGEVLRRAYGIDPNIFGGELGTETGKFTRSTSTTSNVTKKKNSEDEEHLDESSEEEQDNKSSSEEEEKVEQDKVPDKRKPSGKSKSRNKKESKESKKSKSPSSTTTIAPTTPKPKTTLATTPTPTTTLATTPTPTTTPTTTPKPTTTLATIPTPTTTTVATTTPKTESTTTTPTTIITSTTPTTTTSTPTTTTTSPPPTTMSTTTTTTTTPTTTPPPPPNSTTTSSQESVHFTISVLSSQPHKHYDHEATSESRRKSQPSAEKGIKSHRESLEKVTNPSEYSSSEEYSEDDDEDSSTSSSSSVEEESPAKLEDTTKSHLKTNGHQKIPLKIADEVEPDHTHELIPLYFESAKMRDDFSTAEYDDMMLESGHKKKDLSSDMSKNTRDGENMERGENSEESSTGGRSKKRKKIKPSLARRLIQGGSGQGKKRVQKVKKPKNGLKNYSKNESSDKNRI